jgi:hypothetical protein
MFIFCVSGFTFVHLDAKYCLSVSLRKPVKVKGKLIKAGHRQRLVAA